MERFDGDLYVLVPGQLHGPSVFLGDLLSKDGAVPVHYALETPLMVQLHN